MLLGDVALPISTDTTPGVAAHASMGERASEASHGAARRAFCVDCGADYLRAALTLVGGRLVCPTCLHERDERVGPRVICDRGPCRVMVEEEAPF